MVQIKALVALALAAITTALPEPVEPADVPNDGITTFAAADRYIFYKGNGSPAAGWPTKDDWLTFAELWEKNQPILKQSCGWNGWDANDSPEEIANIKKSIQSVASDTGVDQRFVLAIVLQESNGCVRVPTTDNGVRNPGLMQSHNGDGTCVGVNPCPAAKIQQMIVDGTAGTSHGDGLKQTLAQAVDHLGNGKNARAYYGAARIYNSGKIDWNNLNDGLGATPCYSCDVANRLTGWVLADRLCNL
jgi:hypothetical protein